MRAKVQLGSQSRSQSGGPELSPKYTASKLRIIKGTEIFDNEFPRWFIVCLQAQKSCAGREDVLTPPG
jgi:hypothetical protein